MSRTPLMARGRKPEGAGALAAFETASRNCWILRLIEREDLAYMTDRDRVGYRSAPVPALTVRAAVAGAHVFPAAQGRVEHPRVFMTVALRSLIA